MPCSFQDRGWGCFFSFFKTVYNLLKIVGRRGECVPCHSAQVGVEKNFLAVGSFCPPCSEAGISLVLVTALHTSGASHVGMTVTFSFLHEFKGLNSGSSRACFYQPSHLPRLWFSFYDWISVVGKALLLPGFRACLWLARLTGHRSSFVHTSGPKPFHSPFSMTLFLFFLSGFLFFKPLVCSYIVKTKGKQRKSEKRQRWNALLFFCCSKLKVPFADRSRG